MKINSKTFSRFKQLLQLPPTIANLNELLKIFNKALVYISAQYRATMWQNEQFRQILENNSLISIDQRLEIFEIALKNKRKKIINVILKYPSLQNWFTQTPIDPQSVDKRLLLIKLALKNNNPILLKLLINNSSFKETLSNILLNNSYDSKVTWNRIFKLFQSAFLNHQNNLTNFLLSLNEDFKIWLRGETIKDPQTDKTYSIDINNFEQILFSSVKFRCTQFSQAIFSNKILDNWLNDAPLLKILDLFKTLTNKKSQLGMNRVWKNCERLRNAYCGYFDTTNMKSISDQELLENFFKLSAARNYALIKEMFHNNLRLQNLLKTTESKTSQKILEKIIFTGKTHPSLKFLKEYLAIITDKEIIQNILNDPRINTLGSYSTKHLENRLNELIPKSTSPFPPLPLELNKKTNKRKIEDTFELNSDINDKKIILDSLINYINKNNYIKKIPSPTQLQKLNYHMIEDKVIARYFGLLRDEIGIKYVKLSPSENSYCKIYPRDLQRYKKFWEKNIAPLLQTSSIFQETEKKQFSCTETTKENDCFNSVYQSAITFFPKPNLNKNDCLSLEVTEEDLDNWATMKPFTS